MEIELIAHSTITHIWTKPVRHMYFLHKTQHSLPGLNTHCAWGSFKPAKSPRESAKAWKAWPQVDHKEAHWLTCDSWNTKAEWYPAELQLETCTLGHLKFWPCLTFLPMTAKAPLSTDLGGYKSSVVSRRISKVTWSLWRVISHGPGPSGAGGMQPAPPGLTLHLWSRCGLPGIAQSHHPVMVILRRDG